MTHYQFIIFFCVLLLSVSYFLWGCWSHWSKSKYLLLGELIISNSLIMKNKVFYLASRADYILLNIKRRQAITKTEFYNIHKNNDNTIIYTQVISNLLKASSMKSKNNFNNNLESDRSIMLNYVFGWLEFSIKIVASTESKYTLKNTYEAEFIKCVSIRAFW